MNPTAPPDPLQKRAQLAILTGVDALTAKGHLDHALIHAKHGRIDHGVLTNLQHAAEALDRAVKGAERCRKRLLRKVDRLAADAGSTA